MLVPTAENASEAVGHFGMFVHQISLLAGIGVQIKKIRLRIGDVIREFPFVHADRFLRVGELQNRENRAVFARVVGREDVDSLPTGMR